MYDVLIVGGGPAGSSLAWSLRETDLSVAILDKQTFPRDKICAGWVTPAVMQELQLDLDDYQQGRVLQSIHGFRVGQIGHKLVDSIYPGDPISYGIRRLEFDDYLLRRSGAQLLLGQKFTSLQRESHHWCVNQEFKARLVVGAGGHFCPLARAVGACQQGSEQVVAAQEIEFKMSPQQARDCPVDARFPELFFTPDLAGYGWVFRKGDYLNIGLGREDRHRLSTHVQRFVEGLKQQGKIPQDTPEKFSGHAYLLYPHALRRVVNDGVMLIGDAVGLAYPQSGEGIRPAVESALMAADVIKNCQGNYQQRQLNQYHQLLTQRFGARQPAPDLFERLPAKLKQMLASRLMQTQWFTKSMVMDRWFLQSHQSPLINSMPAIQDKRIDLN